MQDVSSSEAQIMHYVSFVYPSIKQLKKPCHATHCRVQSSSKQLCTAGKFDWNSGKGQSLTGPNQRGRLFAVNRPRGNRVSNSFGDLENKKERVGGTQLTQAPPPLSGEIHLASAGRTTIKRKPFPGVNPKSQCSAAQDTEGLASSLPKG